MTGSPRGYLQDGRWLEFVNVERSLVPTYFTSSFCILLLLKSLGFFNTKERQERQGLHV